MLVGRNEGVKKMQPATFSTAIIMTRGNRGSWKVRTSPRSERDGAAARFADSKPSPSHWALLPPPHPVTPCSSPDGDGDIKGPLETVGGLPDLQLPHPAQTRSWS